MVTQTNWNELFDRWAALIRPERRVAYLQDRFRSVKPKILTKVDISGQLSAWSFLNLNQWEDLSDDYLLYINVSDAGGDRTVDVYNSDSRAGGAKIATGTRTGDGAITLAEANSSGVSGSVTVVFANQDDTIVLLIDPAYKESLDDLAAETTDDDQSLLRDDSDRNAKNTYDSIQNALAGERSKLLTDQDFFVFTVARDLIESGESFAAAVQENLQTGGSVTLDEEGVIKDLIDTMIADSQDLIGSSPVLGADALTSTDGSATITRSVQNWVRESKFRFTCNKTIDAAGPETFRVVNDKLGQAPNDLTFGAQFRSGALGLEYLLERSLIFVAGTSSSEGSAWTLSGESSNSVDMGTAGGRLYANITSDGSAHTILLYRASGLADVDLVATGSIDGSAEKSVTFTAENGSGLNIACLFTWVDNGTFSLDLGAFAVDDFIEFSITTENSGLMAKYLGNRYRMEFPVDSSSPSLDTAGALIKIPEDILLNLAVDEIIY